MEEVKILSDDDISSLFADNALLSDNQAESKISDEEARQIFDENKEVVEEEPKEEKVVEENKSYIDIQSIVDELKNEGYINEGLELKDKESLKSLIINSINSGIDDENKRIKEAINAGMSVNEISEFKNTISFLDKITNENLTDESNEGFQLRQKLILQDFINQGLDEKEAVAKTNEIFKKGEDMNTAKKALENNKNFFNEAFNNLIEENKKKAAEEEEEINKQTEELKSAIFGSDTYLGEIEIDDTIKKQALKNLSEPIFKDKETGALLTPLQRYQKQNKTEFLKNLGLFFTLTDEFKNMDKFFNKAVAKRMNKKMIEMEDKLKNPESFDDTLTPVQSKKSRLIDNFKFAV